MALCLLDVYPELGFLAHMGVLFLNFEESPCGFLGGLHHSAFPLEVNKGSSFPILSTFICFNNSHSDWHCKVLIVV